MNTKYPEDFILTIPQQPIISSQGEATSRIFTKIIGKQNNWYIPFKSGDRGANVYADTKNPNSQGMAGSTLPFKLVNGEVDMVKGPWCGNAGDMFKDTGIDITDEHVTYVVLAMENLSKWPTHSYRGIVYADPEGGLEGSFERYKELIEKYPEARYYYAASRGGNHSFFTPNGLKEHEAKKQAEIAAK